MSRGPISVPRHSGLTLGDEALDPDTISEVIGALGDMQMADIGRTPRLAGNVMSDAALIIRALADKAGIEID
ncbi:hypothetical protein HTT03_09460 [Sulfitobacter sp. S0837]|uniref:hypothetical protein n=1 Tax=Sulfitobacter maritimus TaxID=2741719 RepID=UPI0015830BF1|nr:hypothetical protein [Sulfitobacter maritimus]NUH65512.1 hypothetical protein [Sulfitobacter maritimus]